MIFVNRRREADRLQRFLEANGVHAQAISGDVPQTKRQRLLREFQSGDLPVLIGTDVASRGLHIPDVSHVFNFDLPDDAEDYVHRIGRTARAGAYGDAISFGCEDYAQNLPAIEEYVGYKIPVGTIESGSSARHQDPAQTATSPDQQKTTEKTWAAARPAPATGTGRNRMPATRGRWYPLTQIMWSQELDRTRLIAAVRRIAADAGDEIMNIYTA